MRKAAVLLSLSLLLVSFAAAGAAFAAGGRSVIAGSDLGYSSEPIEPIGSLVKPYFAIVTPGTREVEVYTYRLPVRGYDDYVPLGFVWTTTTVNHAPFLKDGRMFVPYSLLVNLAPDPVGEKFYDPDLYLPIREVAGTLGMEVEWDGLKAILFRIRDYFDRNESVDRLVARIKAGEVTTIYEPIDISGGVKSEQKS